MASNKAPKQWCLTLKESINTFETWKNNFIYILSLEQNFTAFLTTGLQWQKQCKANQLRGFTDDGEGVPANDRKTAAQKCSSLNLMLGQIANYAPVISRNTIVKNSTSLEDIWQKIRTHYGFQSTGSHFLDLASFKLEAQERPEDLFQRLTSFFEDNLLTVASNISHHGENITEDEEVTPTIENVIVLLWLQLIDHDLPKLVKQRYGTELRSRTLASIKPEISLALDSLLEELQCIQDIKVSRSMASYNYNKPTGSQRQWKTKSQARPQSSKRPSCILCRTANKRDYFHFLSKCPNLPEEDRIYMGRTRQVCLEEFENEPETQKSTQEESFSVIQSSESHTTDKAENPNPQLSLARVAINNCPYINLFYRHYPVHVILDSGAEANLINQNLVNQMGITLSKTSHSAVQADGKTQLNVTGEIQIILNREGYEFKLEALAVQGLGSDILAGVPFLSQNDILLRTSRKEV